MNYTNARTVQEAVHALNEIGEGAAVLAGGTDFMTEFNRAGTARNRSIVHIGEIKELKEVWESGTYLHIGALATAAELAASPRVTSLAPALSQAAAASAGPQVRNRATIGGNIGTASPAGDLITALWALDATIVVAGLGGTDERRIQDIVIGVKRTALAADELITEIKIPKYGEVSAFEKMGKRSAMTISFASVACALKLDGATIEFARIAIGAAAPTTVRAMALEEALVGLSLEEKRIREAAELAKEAISPITDQRATKWYRMEVVPALTARTILKAAEHNTEEGQI